MSIPPDPHPNQADDWHPPSESDDWRYGLLAEAIQDFTGLDSRVHPGYGAGPIVVTFVDGLEVGDQGRVYISWAQIRPDGMVTGIMQEGILGIRLEGTLDFYDGPNAGSSDYVLVADPEAPATIKDWVSAIMDHRVDLPGR